MGAGGSYRIWTAKSDGTILNYSSSAVPDPADPQAVNIYFGVDPQAPQPPPKEQIDLQVEIGRVLDAATKLYRAGSSSQPDSFRLVYVRLFRLAQLGLEGKDASAELARGGLNAVIADLIDNEEARVKNGHLALLGRTAFNFIVLFLIAYLLLRVFNGDVASRLLTMLRIDGSVAANFMMLWVGCFVGTWLSYGIRTTTFTLADLTSADSERLLPHFRLLFSGLLTMVLGLLFVHGIIEVKIGNYAITDVASSPVLALIVGVFCGISEIALPATVSKRAAAFVETLK
jgi:hypothetical protein